METIKHSCNWFLLWGDETDSDLRGNRHRCSSLSFSLSTLVWGIGFQLWKILPLRTESNKLLVHPFTSSGILRRDPGTGLASHLTGPFDHLTPVHLSVFPFNLAFFHSVQTHVTHKFIVLKIFIILNHCTYSLHKKQPLPPTASWSLWAYVCLQFHDCLLCKAPPDLLRSIPQFWTRLSWYALKAFSTILESCAISKIPF